MPQHDPGVDHRYQYPQGGTDWARIEAMTDEEALQNALNDPDNPPLTDEQLARMRRVPNPQQIRENLGLTQREFARQFQIALGTLRDWEQGVRRPDSTARAYLWVIEEYPDVVRDALEYPKQSKTASTAPAAPPARAASR
jgi:putative transcriptional regulator